MSSRSRILPAALLCATWLGCHRSQASNPPASPRVHLPPAVPAPSVPAATESPETIRPACPSASTRLDAAAQAFDSKHYDVALACAEDELLEDPESVEAEHQRGLALAALGMVDEGRLALVHALALDPDDPEVLVDAADLYLTRGSVTREFDEIALAYARRGERHARRHRTELLEQLELLEGMALNDLGRFEESVQVLDRSLARDPDDLDARYEHGVALFELCRFEAAKADLKRLLSKLPDDAFGHHELGLTLEQLGEVRQAQSELARATALDPQAFPPPVPVDMDEFKRMVADAVRALPPQQRNDLGQVRLGEEELPDLSDLTVDDPPLSPTILGLFRGEPVGAPSSGSTEPRAILLYRRNLVRVARDRAELAKQIQITLWHELGHLRGADDDELRLRGLE